MSKLIFPAAVKTALLPLLTQKLFYGAAISCAVGLGLGVWLQPPKPHYGSTATPVVTLPQEQPNLWGDVAEASPAPSQPYAQAPADQTAAVSPPADVQPVQLASSDGAQAAAPGAAPSADLITDSDPGPTQAAYTAPPPDQTQRYRRDRSGYDARRDNQDYLDDAPPPAQWQGPPPRRWGPPQDDRGPPPGWNGPPQAGAPDGGDGG